MTMCPTPASASLTTLLHPPAVIQAKLSARDRMTPSRRRFSSHSRTLWRLAAASSRTCGSEPISATGTRISSDERRLGDFGEDWDKQDGSAFVLMREASERPFPESTAKERAPDFPAG